MIINNDYRDLAVFTIAQDEPEFIHPWINHYKNHVADLKDIYVLVHSPAGPDGVPLRPEDLPAWQRAEALLAKHHGVTVVPVHHISAFDHQWLSKTVCRFQSFLLQSYDWVLFAEVDEFVFPTPDTSCTRKALLKYVREWSASNPSAIRATGFEVIHQDGEPSVPPERYSTGANFALTAGDLIESRHWLRPSHQYSKTLLARVPLQWSIGFHTVEGSMREIATGQASNSLTLIHLHKVDFEMALARRRRIQARKWSQIDIDNQWGWQNRIDTAAQLRAFWEQDIDTGALAEAGRLLPFPNDFRQALGSGSGAQANPVEA
jgi:hypothetical protein